MRGRLRRNPQWAAEAEADVRTTVDTARLKGANPFAVIVDSLA
jgi:transposase